jgi:hypothetical protein
VPVFDRFGVVIAGLSISFPTLRFSEERLHEYVAMLHRRRVRFLNRWATTTIRSDGGNSATAALRRDRRLISRYQPRLRFYAAPGNC